MRNDELIFYKPIKELFESALIKATRYALLSFPFTINRMEINQVEKRIVNIAKGKLSEYLLYLYLYENNINIDVSENTTQFWQIDHRDFSLKGIEWDIKNNFLYHINELLKKDEYLRLPALIPDRHPKDQFTQFASNPRNGVLFTFMKWADSINDNGFFNVELTNQQKDNLMKLYEKFKGLPQPKEPYTADYFFTKMEFKQCLSYSKIPFLIITSYSKPENAILFQNPSKAENHYEYYNGRPWYVAYNKGHSLKFDSYIKTRIPNKICPIERLNSFQSLVHRQKANL